MGNKGFWRTVLLFGFMTLLLVVPTMQPPVRRLNYGILFHPVGHIDINSDFWRHTFRLTIPKLLPSRPDSSPYACNKYMGSKNSLCHAVNLTLTKSDLMFNRTKDRADTLIQHIYEMIPAIETIKSDSRSKRALLPFVGKLSKNLFGIATTSDVHLLYKHIQVLAHHEETMASAFDHQSNTFSSILHSVDERITHAVQTRDII